MYLISLGHINTLKRTTKDDLYNNFYSTLKQLSNNFNRRLNINIQKRGMPFDIPLNCLLSDVIFKSLAHRFYSINSEYYDDGIRSFFL